MEAKLIDFIHNKHIDSFQKLRFLLFLHQHPDLKESCQQLARRLYFSVLLVERMVEELQAVGLIDRLKNCNALHYEPELQHCLAALAVTFEDPLTRQEMLEQVRGQPSAYQHLERAHEIHG